MFAQTIPMTENNAQGRRGKIIAALALSLIVLLGAFLRFYQLGVLFICNNWNERLYGLDEYTNLLTSRGVIASSQCVPARMYPFLGSGSTFLNGMMTSLLSRASMSSRPTSSEEFELEEKTSTMTRLFEMALEMAAGQSSPGAMSRGAIQQRMPADSIFAQIPSAMGLSLLE